MRVISRKALKAYGRVHRDARQWLENWYRVVRAGDWGNITSVRESFPHADAVKVESLRTVTVFNVCGGKHRLITAIHYNAQTVYVLRVMTHAEYSRDRWKETL